MTDLDASRPRREIIAELFERYGDQIYSLGRSICRGPEEADDLVQEIFLQAQRDWDQFEGRSSPKTWLYTIAHRTCQRMHRRRVGEPTHVESLDELLPFGTPKMAVLPDDVDVFDEQVRREQREKVGEAISSLPDDFRMPLVLKDIAGFSVEEVGEILDVKAATVKTRLHRARMKVRNALAEGFEQRALPPPGYSKQVCLDLLKAKQDSMDRGVPMPRADVIICERCQELFKSLDCARDVCQTLDTAEVPAALRARILASLD